MKTLSITKMEKIKKKLTEISFSSIESKYLSKKIIKQLDVHLAVLDDVKKEILDQDLMQFEEKRVKLIEDEKSGTISRDKLHTELEKLNFEYPESMSKLNLIYKEYEVFTTKDRLVEVDTIPIDCLPDYLEIEDMGALIEIIE